MCRYKFGKGRCAHPSNMALECVGEDRCQFDEDGGIEAPAFGDDDDLEEENRSEGCPDTKIGIYCKKYGHFHCAGEGNCQTREDYIDHLKEHKEAVQNIEEVHNHDIE